MRNLLNKNKNENFDEWLNKTKHRKAEQRSFSNENEDDGLDEFCFSFDVDFDDVRRKQQFRYKPVPLLFYLWI